MGAVSDRSLIRMHSSFLLLVLVSMFILFTSTRPLLLKKQETQELRRTLSVLQTRLQTYVEDKFPEATKEEKHRILKIIGKRMINKISDNMMRGLSRGEKKDLLARMLR